MGTNTGIAELNTKLAESTYNIASMQLVDYVTLIENTYRDLKNELDKDSATLTDAEKAQRINTINAKLATIGDKIEPYLGSLHKKLHGDGTVLDTQGVYKIYADKFKAGKRFFSRANYQDKVKNIFLYYNQIEATAFYLAVEYYHARNMSKTIVDTATEQFSADTQAELDWVNSVKALPEQALIDTVQNLMINEGEYFMSGGQKMKAPFLGSFIDAYMHVSDLNSGAYLSFANWREPWKEEVDAFFSLKPGAVNHRQYLQDQGWTAPVPGGLQFAVPYNYGANYDNPDGRPAWGCRYAEYSRWELYRPADASTWNGSLRESGSNDCSFFVFGLDSGVWGEWRYNLYDDMTPYFAHWIVLRNPGSDEKYIW